jgi:c-di-GMP-binding flagellar brake protein YcgR
MMATSSVKEQTSEYQGQSEKVTHFPQIVGLLRRVFDNHTLLSVSVPGVERQFSSMILGVKPEDNVLLLDELNAVEGHKRLMEASKLTVRCMSEGVHLSFACDIEVVNRPGGAIYKTAIPSSIRYMQRRAAYRVRVALSMEIPVFVSLENGEILEGRLYDLSTLGIGVRIDNQPEIHKDQSFGGCRICFPNGKEMTTEIEIRHVLEDTDHKPVRFGARFVGLEPDQKHVVRHMVTHLEREWLRKNTRNR